MCFFRLVFSYQKSCDANIEMKDLLLNGSRRESKRFYRSIIIYTFNNQQFITRPFFSFGKPDRIIFETKNQAFLPPPQRYYYQEWTFSSLYSYNYRLSAQNNAKIQQSVQHR